MNLGLVGAGSVGAGKEVAKSMPRRVTILGPTELFVELGLEGGCMRMDGRTGGSICLE
jgi:hypothetical protein